MSDAYQAKRLPPEGLRPLPRWDARVRVGVVVVVLRLLQSICSSRTCVCSQVFVSELEITVVLNMCGCLGHWRSLSFAWILGDGPETQNVSGSKEDSCEAGCDFQHQKVAFSHNYTAAWHESNEDME
jgi:hypothetical protein